MSDQSGKELASISNPQEKISPREMDLGTAQTILRGVVSFQEQTMTENSPRDRIGEYSTEQIRQAMRLVGKDLISKYKIKEEARNYEFFDTDITLNKLGRWPEKKRIFLEFKYGKGESDDSKFEEISLHRHNNKKRHWPYIYGKDQRIDFYYPLKDPQNSLELSAYHALFRDYWHSGDGKIVRYRDLVDDFKLDDYRFMIRGLQWLSANMLTWGDKGFIMPEQFDNPSLVRRLSKK